jgi:hypothetical protein
MPISFCHYNFFRNTASGIEFFNGNAGTFSFPHLRLRWIDPPEISRRSGFGLRENYGKGESRWA